MASIFYIPRDAGGQGVLFVFDATLSESVRHTNQVTSHFIARSADITDHVHRMPLTLDLRVVLSETPLADLEAETDPRSAGAYVPGRYRSVASVIGITRERRFQSAQANVSGGVPWPLKLPGAPRPYLPAVASPAAFSSRLEPVAVDVTRAVVASGDRLLEMYKALVALHESAVPCTVRGRLGEFENMVLESLSAPVPESRALQFDLSFKQASFATVSTTEVTIQRQPAQRRAVPVQQPVPALSVDETIGQAPINFSGGESLTAAGADAVIQWSEAPANQSGAP